MSTKEKKFKEKIDNVSKVEPCLLLHTLTVC